MLFDLSSDIGEKNDLAKKNPEKLKEVKAIFQSWSDRMEEPRWISQDRTNAKIGGKFKTAAKPQTRNGANLTPLNAWTASFVQTRTATAASPAKNTADNTSTPSTATAMALSPVKRPKRWQSRHID